MKKLLIIMVLTMSVFVANAQHGFIDSRLLVKFQQEDLNAILQNDPQQITYLNWFLDNGYVVKQTTPEVASQFPPLRYFDGETKSTGAEVTCYDPDNFNIMEYDIEIMPQHTQAFRIGDLGYVVNILSASKLNQNFNKYIKSHEQY